MLKKISVLVVEDVAEMQGLLEHLFVGIQEVRLSGIVKNSSEARQAVYRNRPDLVFLDEVLPGESSLDLLAEFALQGIAVALITSMEVPRGELPTGVLKRLAKPGWKSLEEDQARFQKFIVDLPLFDAKR